MLVLLVEWRGWAVVIVYLDALWESGWGRRAGGELQLILVELPGSPDFRRRRTLIHIARLGQVAGPRQRHWSW